MTNSVRVRSQVAVLRRTMKETPDPEHAVQEKRYLKSPLKVFGTSLPFPDKLARDFRKANGTVE